MTNEIRAVILDAFGTLIRVTRGGSAQHIMGVIRRETGAEPDENEFLREWKAIYVRMTAENQPYMTEREIFTARISAFFERYGVKRSAAREAGEMIREAGSRALFDDAIPAIDSLRRRCRVYIGSNTDDDVLGAILAREALNVDGAFTSQQLKCYKPAPRFYREILARIGVAPGQAVFVGDSLPEDYYAPARIGMRAIWLNRAGESAPPGVEAAQSLREAAARLTGGAAAG